MRRALQGTADARPRPRHRHLPRARAAAACEPSTSVKWSVTVPDWSSAAHSGLMLRGDNGYYAAPVRRAPGLASCASASLAAAIAAVAATPAAGRARPADAGRDRDASRSSPLRSVDVREAPRHVPQTRASTRTLTPVAGPITAVVASLISGDAQFVGVSAGTAALLKSRDAPVKVVAAGATYDPKAPNTCARRRPRQGDHASARPRRQDDRRRRA